MVGLALVAGGFVAIYLGWDGMARLTCVDCQLPYLLSGGMTGLGLIVLGSAVLVIAQMRAERLRLFQTLERAREDDPRRVRMDDTVVLEDHEPETVGAPRRS